MPLSRIIVVLLVLALALGSLGLVGCSSDEESSDETTSEESGSTEEGSEYSIVGAWENGDPVYFSSIEFAEGGTGTAVDIDGTEATIE